MESMYIGSGDVRALLAGKNTKGHMNLLKRFISEEKPNYNAKSSPIDALRTGAILEERFGLILDDNYYPQYRVVSEEMNVFRASIDFAKLEKSKVTDFIELKTCSFNDYLNFEQFRDDIKGGISFIKKKYKDNYRQVQQQLLCSGLDSCELIFLAVYTYSDDENYHRDVNKNEFIRFRIKRDEKVISEIKERGKIFQQIKDYYD